MSCPFCQLTEPVLSNHLAMAVEDNFPASPGHMLIIPRRHILTIDQATGEEAMALFKLLKEVKVIIQDRYGADGFNIGINEGAVAGQTVSHLHIHVIPRRKGDVEDPRGGIRRALPCRHRYP
ncbi:MAG TPA: HIT family protein [Firmicutes bacterium]|nr:HIT family protein [Bacillota bacterium]